MNVQDKKEFISQLIDNVKNDILNRVEAMPENWDGVELREYIKDKFDECACPDFTRRKRKRAYKNELLINGKL